MEIGQGNFIPGLGLPDENLMKGPLFKKESILNDFGGGQGLANVFNKDVLEDAAQFVTFEFKYFYGNMQYTVEILASLKSDKPFIPSGGYVGEAGVEAIEKIPEKVMEGWFKVNMLVALTTNISDMTKMMLESQLSELSASLTAMLIMMESAHNAAEAIIESAERQSEIYKLQAVQGILQAVGGAFQIGMAGGAIYTTSKSRWDPTQNALVSQKTNKQFALTAFSLAGGVTATGAVFTGMGATISGFASAHLVIERSKFDAYKEAQQTIRQLFTQNMESSIQAREDYEAMMKKTLDQLAQITTAARKAAGINPHSI